MKKFFLAFLDHFESWFCQILLCFFVSVIFLQIIFRYLAISAPWTEEISRFAFLWFVLFGACYATRIGAMNRVTIQFAALPPRLASYFLLASDFFWLIFCLVLAWQGFLAILHLERHPCYSPALDWNLAYVYLIFPVSFLLMAIRIIQVNWLRIVTGRKLEDPDRRAFQASQSLLFPNADEKEGSHKPGL